MRWSDLYHAFEIVQGAVGGQMYQLGWISREEANPFSWTANSPDAVGEQARHGHQRNDPPPNPMREKDAGKLIRHLVEWLEWMVEQQR